MLNLLRGVSNESYKSRRKRWKKVKGRQIKETDKEKIRQAISAAAVN